MTTNSRSKIPDPNDKGCDPMEDIQEARDDLLKGNVPEEPTYTSTEKLMKPQDGKDLEY